MSDQPSNDFVTPEIPPQEAQFTEAAQPAPETPAQDPGVTSDDKLWAMLAYLLSPIVPIIILLMEDKKNRPFLKAHTVQALIWGLVLWVISGLLSPLFFIGCVVGVGGFVLTVMWALKANKGEYINIPVITDLVKSQGWA
ncbi:MAG: DUF4870 domain-containing protein [Anaerolineaceae bacterium]|nr:DUF4870 domain-containing protein [Anaerolineaceae bacterium]